MPCTFFEEPFPADAGDVGFQLADGEFGFGFVDAPVAFAYKLFAGIHSFCVYPFDGCIEIEYAAVFHFGSRLEHASVEPFGRETHNLVIHPGTALSGAKPFQVFDARYIASACHPNLHAKRPNISL